MNKTAQKKATLPTINTIDEKHTEMLNHFNTIETITIPNLMTEKNRLKSIIPTLKDSQIDEFMDIRDKIESIGSQIRNLKSQKKTLFTRELEVYIRLFRTEKTDFCWI